VLELKHQDWQSFLKLILKFDNNIPQICGKEGFSTHRSSKRKSPQHGKSDALMSSLQLTKDNLSAPQSSSFGAVRVFNGAARDLEHSKWPPRNDI